MLPALVQKRSPSDERRALEVFPCAVEPERLAPRSATNLLDVGPQMRFCRSGVEKHLHRLGVVPRLVVGIYRPHHRGAL